MQECTSPFFVVWKPSFAVGLPVIDAEHRRFLGMMNELYDAMARGDSDEQMRTTHAHLMAYASFHFSGEEELLATVQFPGRAMHEKQHSWFTAQLPSLQLDRTDGSRAALVFMKDWFVEHILQTDKAYAAWIEANVTLAPAFPRTYQPPPALRR